MYEIGLQYNSEDQCPYLQINNSDALIMSEVIYINAGGRREGITFLNVLGRTLTKSLVQGDFKLCERLHKLAGKKVIATQNFNSHYCKEQLKRFLLHACAMVCVNIRVAVAFLTITYVMANTIHNHWVILTTSCLYTSEYSY
jgi:hypothetical protein